MIRSVFCIALYLCFSALSLNGFDEIQESSPSISSKAICLTLKAQSLLASGKAEDRIASIQILRQIMHHSSFKRLQSPIQMKIVYILLDAYEQSELFEEEIFLLKQQLKRPELWRYVTTLKVSLAKTHIKQGQFKDADLLLRQLCSLNCRALSLQEKKEIAEALLIREKALLARLCRVKEFLFRDQINEATSLLEAILPTLETDQMPFQDSPLAKKTLTSTVLFTLAECYTKLGKETQSQALLKKLEQDSLATISPTLPLQVNLLSTLLHEATPTESLRQLLSLHPEYSSQTILWYVQRALHKPTWSQSMSVWHELAQEHLVGSSLTTQYMNGMQALIQGDSKKACHLLKEKLFDLTFYPISFQKQYVEGYLEALWLRALTCFFVDQEAGFHEAIDQQKMLESTLQSLNIPPRSRCFQTLACIKSTKPVPQDCLAKNLHPVELLLNKLLEGKKVDDEQKQDRRQLDDCHQPNVVADFFLDSKDAISALSLTDSLFLQIAAFHIYPSYFKNWHFSKPPLWKPPHQSNSSLSNDSRFEMKDATIAMNIKVPHSWANNSFSHGSLSQTCPLVELFGILSQIHQGHFDWQKNSTKLEAMLSEVTLRDAHPQIAHLFLAHAIQNNETKNTIDFLAQRFITLAPSYGKKNCALFEYFIYLDTNAISSFEEKKAIVDAIQQGTFNKWSMLLMLYLQETNQLTRYGIKESSFYTILEQRDTAKRLQKEAAKTQEAGQKTDLIRQSLVHFYTAEELLQTYIKTLDPEEKTVALGLYSTILDQWAKLLFEQTLSEHPFLDLEDHLKKASETLIKALFFLQSQDEYHEITLHPKVRLHVQEVQTATDLFYEIFTGKYEQALTKMNALPEEVFSNSPPILKSVLYLVQSLRKRDTPTESWPLLTKCHETDIQHIDPELALQVAIEKSIYLKEKGNYSQSMAYLSWVINDSAVSALRIKAMVLRAELYMQIKRPELAIRQLESARGKGGEWGQVAERKLKKYKG